MTLSDFVLTFNYFVILYFLAINGVYTAVFILSFIEISDYARREVFGGLSELFTSNYAPPVSVVVPAYNEAATIAMSVRSLLSLHYPMHEVVIVNDGSKDGTLEVLKREFDLWESDQPVRLQLKTAPIRGVYSSTTERLVVVDKENGGRSDAQNAGICAARYPFVCCTDADVIMEEDALLRVARPMVESTKVVAVGGVIRVANGCDVESGRVVEVHTPKKALPNFQIVEYLRAFMAGRTGWSVLNCMLIVSGAFGLFRRQDVIAAGGLATDSIGEDMELTTRMHRTLRENRTPYRIVFVPDPVAWTEVPDTLKVLGRQRDRWHRGLIDALLRNRRMLFNPRYGTVGLIGMPYFFLFEFLGPVVELTGYVAFVAGLILGLIDLEFALLFFLVAVGLGSLLSVAAVFLEELRFKRYPRWRDLAKLTIYGILENFGYRQLNTFWRVRGIISFLRKNTEWGDMERKGFDADKIKKIAPEEQPIIVQKVTRKGDRGRIMGIFRRSAAKAKVEENTEVDGRTSPTPADQLTGPAGAQEPAASNRELVKGLEDLGEVISVVGDYRKSLDRESEDVSSFVQNFREHVEQVSSRRGKLEEAARELSELCEKLEQETAEVSTLRDRIEEKVSRIQELLDQHQLKS